MAYGGDADGTGGGFGRGSVGSSGSGEGNDGGSTGGGYGGGSGRNWGGYGGSYDATSPNFNLGEVNRISSGGYGGGGLGSGNYGMDSFGLPTDFSSFISYDAMAPSILGDLGRSSFNNAFNSGYGRGDNFGDMGMSGELSDMFVDPMTEEERLKRMGLSTAMGAIAGAAPGPLGALATNALGVASGTVSQPQMASNMGRTIATGIGSALGGPFGGLVGNVLGRMATAGGPTGPAPGRAEGQNANGSPWMDLGKGLVGMYQANRASKDARNAQNNITAGVDARLADMFGPNSAYAQQLRQQLDRRDAAAGRRSQYGPREVELQAKLAEMSSRTAPSLINSMVGQQGAALQAAQMKRAQQNAMLNTLFGVGQKTGVFDRIGQGLGGLFGGQGGQQPQSNDWMNDGAAWEGIY